ncbi:FAD-dependent oxidoreductase [Oceanobacillus kimchii]|uniref:FAD-dependent oxidoreductase n=1 Tax=Oceanobacillus kimchii TaxID=746691 RepID=UPI00158DCEB6|nr:NAD(P)/FAD-dependent oxidoreductase [Oceanobacillus kimchii]
MNHSKAETIIIGSGVAGLSTALFLHKAGINSVVYESAPEERETGAGFVLAPPGVNILKTLGINEIEKYSHQIKKIVVHNRDDEEISSSSLTGNNYFYNRFMTFNRHNLVSILLDEVLKIGIKVNYNKRLVNVEQNPQGVTAIFADNTEVQGEILIGADGIHSKTRESIFSNIKSIYSGFYGIHGITSSTLINIKIENEAKVYIDPDEKIGVYISKSYPESKDDILWQLLGWSERKIPVNNLELSDTEEMKDFLLSKTNKWNTPFSEVMKSSKVIYPRSIFELEEMNHWSQGRVVLVGDALHATNPIFGLGASWALEDSMYLAKMLRDHGYRDAFHYYEVDRKPRIEPLKKSAEAALRGAFDSFNEPKRMYNHIIQW